MPPVRSHGPSRPPPPASAEEASSSAPLGPGLRRPCGLPPALRLSVAELRSLEHSQPPPAPTPPTAPAPPPPDDGPVPPCGDPRRLWLVARLIRFLREETEECLPTHGSRPEVLLDRFEEVTGVHYTQTPGSDAASRLTGFGKTLGNLTVPGRLVPPLLRHRVAGGRWLYNRVLKVHRSAERWRQRAAQEAAALPAARPTISKEEADAGLAGWLHLHRLLRAARVEEGLPSIALLLLWEVEHNQPFPSTAGGDESALVLGFSKRLRRRVEQDAILSAWMVPRDFAGALAPGLRDCHAQRWPVQIVVPDPGVVDPLFDAFQRRWKEYLATQRVSLDAAAPEARRTRTLEELAPAKRRRTAPPARTPAAAAATSSATPATRTTRARSPPTDDPGPQRKRRFTLDCWLQPTRSTPPPHGRAADGPPT